MKLFMRNERNIEKRVKLHLRHGVMMPMMMMLMIMMLVLLRIADASVAATNATCKHATNMWGDPNPNIFYVCSVADQMPLQLHCPQGRGYFNGHGHLGCLPYDQWPACRPTMELVAAQLAAGCNSSESNAKDQPWATLDPNQFYMCPGVNSAPLLLSCAPGKGFVQTVGCADWSLWRRQMQCEAYY
ncbi:uncharacterized protein LOC115772022 [Drosophila novamexicana]|uniref:uncharacterized protein LOC115772022 n=1 Tax=Drosophila novamexicana TaxID=47314 RepID=UPI0011E58B38|nr:uncharacterized protein LOC115772022 [Drosophila novamexicana]